MKVSTKKMSVAEFSKIPDNPIQRNTVKHATNASRPGGHLSELHPTHFRVAIAVMEDGKRWVLDGHSRRFLWERGDLDPPPFLMCDVYQIDNENEARELYLTYDSTQAVESSQDRLYGAMRYHNFKPVNPILFQNAGTIDAMKRLAFPTRYSDLKNLQMHELVKPWMPTLRIIDSASGIRNHFYFPSWVTIIMLLTVRRDKRIALSFWEAYAQNEGTKEKNMADGIFCARVLVDHVKNNRPGRSNTLISQFSAPLLWLYEEWKEGRKIEINKGSGRPSWGTPVKDELPTLSKWWQEHIGKYDHPQIRRQVELLGDDL